MDVFGFPYVAFICHGLGGLHCWRGPRLDCARLHRSKDSGERNYRIPRQLHLAWPDDDRRSPRYDFVGFGWDSDLNPQGQMAWNTIHHCGSSYRGKLICKLQDIGCDGSGVLYKHEQMVPIGPDTKYDLLIFFKRDTTHDQIESFYPELRSDPGENQRDSPSYR